MREDDRAADARGSRGADQRRHPDRRARRERRPAKGSRHRDGLSELRALSTHERVRQHRVRIEAPRHAQAGDRAPRERGEPDAWHRSAPQAQAEGAVRRTAAARRRRPRDRARTGGVPDGRAAFEPRREAAHPDPRHAAEAASADPPDDDLRDARSGRGHDDGRPYRGDERRRSTAVGHTRKSSRAPGQPVRRRIHRIALHELLPGNGLRIAGQRRRGCRVLQSAAQREGRGVVGQGSDPGSPARGHRRHGARAGRRASSHRGACGRRRVPR